MTKLRIFIGLSVLTMVLTASADPLKDPIEIKGARLGADQAEFEKDDRYSCSEVKSAAEDVRCLRKTGREETIATVVIPGYILSFLNRKLSGISALFRSSDFQTVADAFVVKYGPGELEEREYKNSFGASYIGKNYKWKSPMAVIELKQYVGKTTDSQLLVYTNATIEEFTKRKAAQAASRANDL